MKNLQRNIDRFFLKHREHGIRDLMLYIAIGNLIVYAFSLFDRSMLFARILCFDRAAILGGQVWRLLTFILVPDTMGGLMGSILTLLLFFFYFRIGRLLENAMGRLKFNLFYLCGVLILDVFGLVFPVLYPSSSNLNFSLLLAFATLYPEGMVLLFGIIPLKMKYLAWFYLAMMAVEIFIRISFAPLIPLLNFILFFWSDIPKLLPFLNRTTARKHPPRQPKGPHMYQGDTKTQKAYRHKCTVCGRTDTDFPNLEFRYCSRCSGYHCYCIDHINNHAHIQ